MPATTLITHRKSRPILRLHHLNVADPRPNHAYGAPSACLRLPSMRKPVHHTGLCGR